jgi:hypothetical protein
LASHGLLMTYRGVPELIGLQQYQREKISRVDNMTAILGGGEPASEGKDEREDAIQS